MSPGSSSGWAQKTETELGMVRKANESYIGRIRGEERLKVGSGRSLRVRGRRGKGACGEVGRRVPMPAKGAQGAFAGKHAHPAGQEMPPLPEAL